VSGRSSSDMYRQSEGERRAFTESFKPVRHAERVQEIITNFRSENYARRLSSRDVRATVLT